MSKPLTNHAEYDLVVIGGGSAGLTAAGIGVTVGARTIMIERARLGGDCTWTGCIPSKTLLKIANVAHTVRTADRFGIAAQAPAVNFPLAMRHVRDVRSRVYHEADRPELFEEMGIEVVKASARFVGRGAIEIESDSGSRRISGRFFVIATGGRPDIPPVDGLAEVPYWTSENVFEIEDQPARLTILGAGPIGNEMAQAFQRLGTSVTVVDEQDRIQSNDDEELADLLKARLETEGVTCVLGAAATRVHQDGAEIVLRVEQDGILREIRSDALLIATGRRPNTENLNLDAAGVAYRSAGIIVNERCRTDRKHIYAVGDVTGEYQFTHMSEHMAKVAVANALLGLPKKIDRKHVPWVTFTDPELAHIGATERDLQRLGTRYELYRFPYEKIDRAVTDGAQTGLIKVFATRYTGRILGVAILGAHAGEMIGEFALAMKNGIPLRKISDTIHPYPTYGLAVRRAADQWYIRQYPHRLFGVLRKLFRYRGNVIQYGSDEIV